MPLRSGPFRLWNDESMQTVTAGVEWGGHNICRAAEKCDIPHSTLHVTGKIEHDRSSSSYLPSEEEQLVGLISHWSAHELAIHIAAQKRVMVLSRMKWGSFLRAGGSILMNMIKTLACGLHPYCHIYPRAMALLEDTLKAANGSFWQPFPYY